MNPARSPQRTACLPIVRVDVEHGRLDVGGGGDGADHLDQLHDRRRVEEVHADDISRAGGGRGALDHRQARRRGGQHRARRADLVEVREQRLLDGEILDDRLDDQLDVGQVVESGRAGDPGRGRRRDRTRSSLPRCTAFSSERVIAAGDLGDLVGASRHEQDVVAAPWRRPRRCRWPSCPEPTTPTCCTGARALDRRPAAAGVWRIGDDVRRIGRVVGVEAAAATYARAGPPSSSA